MGNLQNKIAIAQNNSDKKQGYSDIKIRPLTMSDIDDCMEWLRDPKVSKFCSWDCFTSKEAATKYLEREVNHPWYKAICLNDKPVGWISVTPYKGDYRCRAELGYLVGSKYWGKGIATKAVKMVISEIFLEWTHLKRLEALVDVKILRSQKVLKKAGFSKEGVRRSFWLMKGKTPRDVVMFSLLYSDTIVGLV